MATSGSQAAASLAIASNTARTAAFRIAGRLIERPKWPHSGHFNRRSSRMQSRFSKAENVWRDSAHQPEISRQSLSAPRLSWCVNSPETAPLCPTPKRGREAAVSAKDCLVRDAVQSEPVSASEYRVTQGLYREKCTFRQLSALTECTRSLQCHRFPAGIPCRAEHGIIRRT